MILLIQLSSHYGTLTLEKHTTPVLGIWAQKFKLVCQAPYSPRQLLIPQCLEKDWMIWNVPCYMSFSFESWSNWIILFSVTHWRVLILQDKFYLGTSAYFSFSTWLCKKTAENLAKALTRALPFLPHHYLLRFKGIYINMCQIIFIYMYVCPCLHV